MNADQLIKLLATVPGAIEVTVKGRKDTMLSCSIPDGEVPIGWRAASEMSSQHVIGFRRILYVG
jgi:hypothetical protein